MSRIGKVPLEIPKDVKVAIEGRALNLQGPKGKASLDLPLGIKAEQKDNAITITRVSDIKQNRANHGTVRALVSNMLIGVTEGHKKQLEIHGVGFRAQLKGDTLAINLGFSHPVEYKIPKEVKVSVSKPTEITVEGTDKCDVGLVASKIRGLKPPEPYKGKGIRYVGERVRQKQGKSITK